MGKDKAYNRCLVCEYLGEGCDGPNILAMTPQRWSEWCRDLKKIRGYTNQQIADKANVSVQTVGNILSGKLETDIRWYTASQINKVLVGSAGKWPCAMVLESSAPEFFKDLENKTSELQTLKAMYDKIHASYQQEIDIIRKEAKEKIDFLKAENEKKDRIINRLLDR